jgi:hypothetical protein
MEELEIWLTTTVDPNYEVSNLGKIRNKATKKELKCGVNRKGYVRVNLRIKTYLVNRLVALAFIPNPDNLPQVDHKDNDLRNNRVSNLAWITNEENNKSHKKRPRGKFKRMTREEIIYIHSMKNIKPASEIAKILGRSEDSISKVWRGVNKNARDLKPN